jgi:hypothetical protein
MEAENVAAVVLVRVPGKERPIGLLGIGSSVPRAFESDEEHFLVNVANLLGLTIQNVALFESAATSKRQWLDTFGSIHDLILVHSPDGRILRAKRSLGISAWSRTSSKGSTCVDCCDKAAHPGAFVPIVKALREKRKTPIRLSADIFLLPTQLFTIPKARGSSSYMC